MSWVDSDGDEVYGMVVTDPEDEVFPAHLRQYISCQCCIIPPPIDLPLTPISTTPVLIVDSICQTKIPRNYRNATTLDLRASISGQMSRDEFGVLVNELGTKSVTVVDLRQESHGYLNDGTAVSWYRCRNTGNLGKTNQQAHEDEYNRVYNDTHTSIHKVGYRMFGSIYDSEVYPLEETVTTSTEEDVVSEFGCKYVRFRVADHQRPEDSVVQEYIDFVSSLDSWIHIHCRAGKGRSTTFMMMYDMMINRRVDPEMSLETFVQRQVDIGGPNMLKPPSCKNKRWKMKAFEHRVEFIRMFYEYCGCSYGLGVLNWVDWINEMHNCDCQHSHSLSYVDAMSE